MTGQRDLAGDAAGPGAFFATHPDAYALSVAGASGAAVAMAVRALRTRGVRRIGWAALALLEAGIVVGIVNARNAAVASAAGTETNHSA